MIATSQLESYVEGLPLSEKAKNDLMGVIYDQAGKMIHEGLLVPSQDGATLLFRLAGHGYDLDLNMATVRSCDAAMMLSKRSKAAGDNKMAEICSKTFAALVAGLAKVSKNIVAIYEQKVLDAASEKVFIRRSTDLAQFQADHPNNIPKAEPCPSLPAEPTFIQSWSNFVCGAVEKTRANDKNVMVGIGSGRVVRAKRIEIDTQKGVITIDGDMMPQGYDPKNSTQSSAGEATAAVVVRLREERIESPRYAGASARH